MPETNKTRYAILGVLSLMPGSGYDIRKFCEKTLSHYWQENFGNIYPMLARLEREGLIERLAGNTGSRKISYCVTGAGQDELSRWLARPVEYQPARSELMLKLSFASLMPPQDVMELLEGVKKRHQERLTQYRVLEAAYIASEAARAHPQYPYWLAPLRYGIESSLMTIRWCDETAASIQNNIVEA